MSLPPADSPTATPRVEQLTDYLYELYKPGVKSRLDVVFFHGLQLSHTSDAHLSTWRSRGPQKEVWPMTWLPEQFPNARILSVNYDAYITTTAEHGRLDLHNTAESLMVDLIFANVGKCPVILVGHSYGGLVIKQLCVNAHMSERMKAENAAFLNCVKGAFFYGTPHRGSSNFFSPNGTQLKDASPLLENVKLLCAESARLHEMFDSLRMTYKWSIAGVGESRPTTFLTQEGESQSEMIVVEASARWIDFTVEAEDHVSLCQPESNISNTYTRLTQFIQRTNKIQEMSFRDDLQTVPRIAMKLRSVLVKTVQELLVRLPLVGLHGMGGVGKTTLAKLLFNVLCAEFEYTCFVPGFMLKGDYKEMEGRVYSSMHRYGKMVTQRRQELEPGDLKGKRLLLVLDNMENEHHVELLKEIVSMNACANSRYIVTSRSLEVLDSCIAIFGRRDVDACVFDVGFLNHDNSNQLFRSHAFPYPDEPSPSMTKWIDKIVEKCEGLPLTLEVMGSYLKRDPREKVWSEKRWSQTLEGLDAAEYIVNFNERLWEKLQVSFNSLSPKEQEIFLDAATFFNNSHWMLFQAKACWRVLYGFEDVQWKTLVDLCIVYNVDETDRILMHEQMRSLGMKLASAWGHNRICRTWTKKNVPSTSSMKLASAWRFHRLFNWTKENEPSTSFSPGMEIEGEQAATHHCEWGIKAGCVCVSALDFEVGSSARERRAGGVRVWRRKWCARPGS